MVSPTRAPGVLRQALRRPAHARRRKADGRVEPRAVAVRKRPEATVRGEAARMAVESRVTEAAAVRRREPRAAAEAGMPEAGPGRVRARTAADPGARFDIQVLVRFDPHRDVCGDTGRCGSGPERDQGCGQSDRKSFQ